MEKLLFVSLRLPAADREYEVRLSAGLNAHIAALLTAQALEGLAGHRQGARQPENHRRKRGAQRLPAAADLIPIFPYRKEQ